MLPEGWRRMTLGEFVSIQRGHDLTESQREKGSIPVIGGGGVNGLHNAANVIGPGVVLGRSGAGFGTAFYCATDFWAHNTGLFVTNFHGNDPKFVFYKLDHIDFRPYNSGGAQPSLNRNFIYPIEIIVPAPPEQRKITQTIEMWDRAIDLTERLIAAKQERRKWLLQQLLTGRQRLPGFVQAWRTAHLGTLFTNRVEINRPGLSLVAITGENGVVRRDDLVRRDTSNDDKSKYLRICPGDIGYNTMRMWQGVCGLSKLEGIVSPAYTIVTPTEQVDGEFMSLLFKSPAVINLFHRHSQGLVNDTLNLKWRHFAEIKVTIPKKTEQQSIATVFRSVDHELDLLRAQLDTLREQKKGLMQQILTGKKRVKISPAEATAEE
jgi:type I restriction enzyme S subunit